MTTQLNATVTTRIIGVSGRAGAGKDTLAGLIPGARRFSFADPLKEFCAEVFGWDRETLWGPSELRNKPDERYQRGIDALARPVYLTPRFALQTLGTEWGRNCCPDVWARLGVRKAQEWAADSAPAKSAAVFADCRFVNEAQAIRDAGGQVWRIVRPGAGLAGDAGAHSSELEQESPEFLSLVNETVANTGSLADLRGAVLAALDRVS